MRTTRSATRKQAAIHDTATEGRGKKKPPVKNAQHTESSSKRKRSTEPASQSTPSSKKPKQKQSEERQQRLSQDNIEKLKSPIVINRAPVLQLWGAMVAQVLHPDLSWAACLSAGNAISSLCAISKGRAIGVIEPKDKQDTADHEEQQKGVRQEGGTISVMGFPLQFKHDAVLMKGKPKSLTEESLKKKFGDENYEATKRAMSEGLETWRDAEEELDQSAFQFYEQFRPDVAAGQQGWGRKGELDLDEVVNVIKRSSN